MDHAEIDRTESMSMAGVPFPQVVGRLVEAGVETYFTDLVGLRKTFYGANGESYAHSVPLAEHAPIPSAFSAGSMRSALAEIQSGRIGYAEFLLRIMRAGTMGYIVFIAGRRVIYYGRDGQFHVEEFPTRSP